MGKLNKEILKLTKFKPGLKRYDVSAEVFETILQTFVPCIQAVSDEQFQDFIFGYGADEGRNTKYYYNEAKERIIVPYYIFNYMAKRKGNEPMWKQCILCKCEEQIDPYSDDVYPRQAISYMNKVLLSVYRTQEAINAKLHAFELEESEKYDEGLQQFHYTYPGEKGKIYEFDNVYKFDINGAHMYALCVIFPEAKNKLLKLYAKRKTDKRIKKFINYYVGCLGSRDKFFYGEFRKTYNAIVAMTTTILKDAMESCECETLLYANTDGFMVNNPKNIINTSANLGDFKLEYSGTAYFYSDKNYVIYQTDEYKGTCLNAVRNKIDLTKRKVVHYDRVYHPELHMFLPENITEETINEDSCQKI